MTKKGKSTINTKMGGSYVVRILTVERMKKTLKIRHYVTGVMYHAGNSSVQIMSSRDFAAHFGIACSTILASKAHACPSEKTDERKTWFGSAYDSNEIYQI